MWQAESQSLLINNRRKDRIRGPNKHPKFRKAVPAGRTRAFELDSERPQGQRDELSRRGNSMSRARKPYAEYGILLANGNLTKV